MNNLYQFWKERKIDWEPEYFDTFDHPHRSIIMQELRRFYPLRTVYELGTGAGANLYRIMREFPHTEVGGMDINLDAIECAKKMLPQAHTLEVGDYESIPFSDKSIDVLMTDAALIYCKPDKIKKVLREMVRVARVGILLCEADSGSRWERMKLRYSRNDTTQPKTISGKIKKRLTMGYNAYDYEELLTELGCYGIKKKKIDNWPDSMWQKFGYVITAKK